MPVRRTAPGLDRTMISPAAEPPPERTSGPSPRAILPTAAYHRLLLARLRARQAERDKGEVIGITSVHHRQGVSTITSDLSVTAASAGLRTLLVEANVARPSLARRWQCAASPGLAEMLAADDGCEEAIHAAQLDNRWWIPAGRPDRRTIAPAASSAFAELLAELRQQFELILVDLPPARPEEPLLPWMSHLDGVLLVLEAERVDEESARRSISALRAGGANLWGAVLNKQRDYLPCWLAGQD